MHKIELYGYGESVASNMARVALSEKNISYEYNLLYLESKGDHLSKKYKKLNPKNLVPTMIDNGNIIPDYEQFTAIILAGAGFKLFLNKQMSMFIH